MGIAAQWTPDCQGKWDFDGPIIEISTRLWPRGGGFHTLDSGTGKWEGNETRPEVNPKANSCIVIRDAEVDHDSVIIEAEFEADTEELVKASVEEWASEQYQRIVAAIKREFTTAPLTE